MSIAGICVCRQKYHFLSGVFAYLADGVYLYAVMKPSRIQYSPYLSLERIAAVSGVTVEAVRRYIKNRCIDRKCDDEILRFRRVRHVIKEKPQATVAEIASDTSMSVGTVRKYIAMQREPRPESGKISVIRTIEMKATSYLSVSRSQNQILRAILQSHLNNALTYDCDLTFGLGRFYSELLAQPRFRYDICPSRDNVEPLGKALKLPDECFESIIIDLPFAIIKPTRRRSKPTFESFDSIDELYKAYKCMIELAWRLLKSDGVLVFKTVDFRMDGQPFWISDWTNATALRRGFMLADKYIYIDENAMNEVASSARRARILDHAYFLVFKKSDVLHK